MPPAPPPKGSKGILHPESRFVLTWTRIFISSCLINLFVDPLFFFIPTIRDGSTEESWCLQSDQKLSIILTVLRTFSDLLYVPHIAVRFRTAYIAPRSRVFGRGELVMNRKKIALRYFTSNFFLDLAASLPLPQIVVWIIIPALENSSGAYQQYQTSIVSALLSQYFLRMYFIFIRGNRMIEATGLVSNNGWAGATYYITLYVLGSHIAGAGYYYIMYSRQTTCWEDEIHAEIMNDQIPDFYSKFLFCDFLGDIHQQVWSDGTEAFTHCKPVNGNIFFDLGMFEDGIKKKILSTTFARKYFYSLWWGVQNLSSFGQNLVTSLYIGETLYASMVGILGLVMMATLIANMQTHLQSITKRLEQWRVKRRDVEFWIEHRKLPGEMHDRVLKYLQYTWFATHGVDEDSILESLPDDLRRDVQCHLCLHLVRRVPLFAQMDDQLLGAICERLQSSLTTEATCVVREGDPVKKMLFVIRGQLESSGSTATGNGSSITLRAGDFCGEELLAWALLPTSTSTNLPSSTRTIKALVDVEAFALRAEDLKFVANHFRRMRNKTLQRTFRFYSHQWRSWAAIFIQDAWRRRYKRRVRR